MGAAANKFGRTSKDSFARANRAALTFKKTVAAIISAQVIGRGMMLMGQAVRGVVSEFVTFDDAITRAGAKFPTAVIRGTKAFARLQEVARQVGATTKFSATEAAEGLDFLAMAGFNAEQAMAALPQVTNLAVVAGEDLARSTDIASDALGAFNLMTQDSAKLTGNLARINDVFAKTVTSANTDIEMLFEAMKDGAPVATAAGASVETFATLVGQMANAGIKGTKAGTTLKNMFLQLQAPVPKAAKLIKKLGLDLIDSEGNLRDIVEILGDFNKATAKMGKAQRSAAIDTIFGKRAIAGVSVLLAQGEDKLDAYRDTILAASGSAQTMADTIGTSLGNRLKALRSAAIELGFRFIDAFKKDLPGAIDGAIEAVRKFNVKPIVEGFKTFVKFIKEAVNVLRDLMPLIKTIVIFTVAYKTAVKALIAVEAIRYFWGMVKAIQAAGAAQGVLNAVMIANPIGLVAAAIAGLVLAGYMLYKQWDGIKEIWGFVVDEFMDGMRAMKRSFSLFGDDVKTKWNTLMITLSDAWEGFKMSSSVAVDEVKTLFTNLWTGIKETFLGVFDKIGTVINNTIGRMKGVLRFLPGIGAGGERPAELPPGGGRQAPNAAEVAAQNIRFRGKLTVAGAPPGSTLEAETRGAPPIQTELAGANL
jgi:TP901 family phage tail tape measure protein